MTQGTGVRPGEVLAGKYRVEQVIGQGGMGVVVAAHHLELDQRVALKFLHPSAIVNPQAVERFVREAQAAVRIRSEHVARVTDVGRLESGAPYMVMEFLEGGDLAAWVAQRGPLEPRQAVDFVLQACEALAEAHALGIVHRDLKPANLFCIRGADDQLSIKVLDFGISKVLAPDTNQLTRTSAMLGSPLYASPEQMMSSRNVDIRTDIWSLGVVLFELVTARVPFDAESPTALAIKLATEIAPLVRTANPAVPVALEQIIARCLERERDRRFQTVGELAVALQELASPRSYVSIERVVATLRKAGMVDTRMSDLFAAAAPAGASTAGSWGQTASRPASSGRAAAGGFAVATLVVVGVAAFFVHRQLGSHAPDVAAATSGPPLVSPPQAGVPPAPSVAVTPPPPTASAPPAVVTPAAASISQAPQPSAPTNAAPLAPPAAVAPAAPPRVVAPPPPHVASPPKAVTCDPPFTIDAHNHHVPKPECL
jgi:tRNA A-37 threonylcarbamoyl transferase component Bud32